jgi:peptide/nickel transport system ATP-binding protein
VTPLLEISGLSVVYKGRGGPQEALREVSLNVEPGQTYGLVGESGSGKSTLALSVLRALGTGGEVRAGRITFAGRDLLALSPRELRHVWRNDLKLVPQNPLVSLNPSQRVGAQVADSITDARNVRARVLELLTQVGLADPQRVAQSYPHELSGGMQQRVVIAMAISNRPKLLVLDEPTTNLDVTTEATILDLIRDLKAAHGTAVLYVSHSLGVIAQVCDRVAVLYAGELVEDAPVAELFAQPLHPYTRGLLDSVPRLGVHSEPLRSVEGSLPEKGTRPPGCIFAPRCPVATDRTRCERPPLETAPGNRRVRCWRWQEIGAGTLDPSQPTRPDTSSLTSKILPEPVLQGFALSKRFPVARTPLGVLRGRPHRELRAVDGIDLELRKGATLGLVGESGSGKSTLARCIVGLTPRDDGRLELHKQPLAPDLAARGLDALRRVQMVFQNADEALNPYRTVGATLRRPLLRLGSYRRAEADERVLQLLRAVKLDPAYAERLPSDLSGGEKQRVAVARAFAAEPEVLLFDESLSGLDVSVQAALLNLLGDLQRDHGSAYLFISHDLAVVSYLADEIAVMYLGHLMEVGPVQDVLSPPYHPYTEALLSAVPRPEPGAPPSPILLKGEVPSPTQVPSGCRFHTRCPHFLGDICRNQEPPWREDRSGKRIYCHIPLEDLVRIQDPPGASQEAAADD